MSKNRARAHSICPGRDLIGEIKALGQPRLAAIIEGLLLGKAEQPFGKVLVDLVEGLKLARDERSIHRRFDAARLPMPSAVLEEAKCSNARGLHRDVVDDLAKGEWVKRQEHIAITGASGTGKTWLACALASTALRHGHVVRYFNVPDLLFAWSTAKARDTLDAFRNTLSRAEVLVLDDWGVERLDEEDVSILRRVLQFPLEHASVIVASPFPENHWLDWLGGEYVGESLVRRLSGGAHRIDLRKGC